MKIMAINSNLFKKIAEVLPLDMRGWTFKDLATFDDTGDHHLIIKHEDGSQIDVEAGMLHYEDIAKDLNKLFQK